MSLIWTNAALEPKRKFKYLISFTNFTDVRFLAQTCDRPGIKVGATEHKYFDKSYFHPGRVSWDPNPLNIKLVDIQRKGGSTTDTNESLLKIFIKSGLQYFADENYLRTIGKQSAVASLGDVNIRVLHSLTDAATVLPPLNDQLGAAPANFNLEQGIAEQWILKNAWLESIKPDALDYGAEDILTVTVAVRYDWATFKSSTGEEILTGKETT